MTDSQFFGHRARAPVGGAVFGTASSVIQNLRLQGGTVRLNLPSLMTTGASGQAFDFETSPPKPDSVDAAAHLSGHGSLSLTFSQSQNDVSAADVFGGQGCGNAAWPAVQIYR